MALFLRKGQVVNMNQTYMKEQKVLPLLLKMSLPMVISMMVNSLYNIVDSFFVAKISENAMTALSLVFPVQNLISSVMIGFAIGINAVISFFMGAQNQKQADKAASQGMLLSCIHAVVLTVICIAGMPVFLKMFTKDAEIVSLGLKYSNIAFAFSIMLGIELMFEKVFQAVGRMNASMVCLMTGCIVNIVLDPMMIFGIGPFPAMGIEGAALATGIGQTSAAVLYIIIYIVKPIPVKFRKSEMRIEGSMAKRLYSIGMPASLSLAIPGLLIGLFTSNPDTINAGETALRIISAGFIVSTVSVTSAGALEGLGKGFPSLIISVCRYVAVIIPVAFVMSRITGAVGVWHAFWITEVITSVISYIVYKKNVK